MFNVPREVFLPGGRSNDDGKASAVPVGNLGDGRGLVLGSDKGTGWSLYTKALGTSLYQGDNMGQHGIPSMCLYVSICIYGL